MVCRSLPETGGVDLASQPTLSRLENAPDARGCYRMAEELFELYMRQRSTDDAPKKILLDFDSTDDPTYGEQEGSYYHTATTKSTCVVILYWSSTARRGRARCGRFASRQYPLQPLRGGDPEAHRGSPEREAWPEVEI
jgi:hypothetical protein